jgi:plastocyanin
LKPLLVAAGALAALLASAAPDAATGAIQGLIRNSLVARWPAAVYVEAIPGRSFRPPAEHPVVDQKSLVFIPHVLPVLKGTTVDFRNSDEVKHNIFSSRKSPTVFNLGTYAFGVVRSVTFDKPGAVTLLCNVHAEMSAYVVVVETPYFAVTDREGRFRIDGVPPGSYRLAFWHEALAAESQPVVVAAGRAASVEWLNPKRK